MTELQTCIACGEELKTFLKGRDNMFRDNTQVYTVLKCVKCGTEKVSPSPTKEEQANFYPKNYYSFTIKPPSRIKRAYYFFLDEIYYKGIGKGFTSLEKALSFQTQGDFLDVGCGNGFRRKKIEKTGRNYTGFEVGEKGIKNNIRYNSDLLAEDFGGKTFDCILLSHVFEHLDNPKAILEKLYTLLNKNGILILRLPCID